MTHRDPTVCAASTMSLCAFLQGQTGRAPDSRAFARRVADFISLCCDRLVDWADRSGDDDLIHVPYGELVSSPIATAEKVAAAAGHAITPVARAAMERHVRERTQHRYGVHRYALEDFGLTERGLADRFAPYRARFVRGAS